MGWFLVGVVAGALREHWVHIKALKLTLMEGIGVLLEVGVRAERLEVARAETASED